MLKRNLVCILGGLLLSACASSTPQMDSFFTSAASIPESQLIENVPFIEQSDFYCGPATLTMVAQWAGRNVSVNELAKQVYTPGMKGSLQVDMISASRRQGLTAIPIQGVRALLQEVAAGHPVIVFENLGLSWAPTWHYAVVIGYDLQTQNIILHSGPNAYQKWDLKKFERSWKLAEYWGLVVLPPGQLSTTADLKDHEKAAAALEHLGKNEEARKSYLAILQKWPDSLIAQLGLGYLAFKEKDFLGAIQYLKKVTTDHPQVAEAWHNLALVYGAAQKKKEARFSASQAIQWALGSEKSKYKENLKEWISDP